MPTDQIIDLPVIGRAGSLHAVDEASRTFEVLWTTGAQVRRYSWARDEEFDEELVVSPNAMRLDRLNGGAPFLNSHASWSLRSILGVVEDGSIRIEAGRAFARIRLSERDEVEDIWRDIKAGIIRNVSVGYRVHRFERVAKADRSDGGTRALYRAVDWEPLEISAVAIGADAAAGIRAEPGDRETRLHPCTITNRADAGSTTLGANITEKGHTMPQANPATEDGDRDDAAREAAPSQQASPQPAPANPAASPAPAAPDADAIRAEERRRSGDIMALCRHAGLADMADDLIGRGVSIDDARAAVLDKLVDSDPAGRTAEPAPAQARDGGAAEIAYRDAVSNALLHRHNPGAHALDTGAREFRGLTLLEMARHAIERRGGSTRGLSKIEVARAAFEQRATGYHSTSDFPAILANVANTTLRQAYASTPRTFGAWARRATITDFKPVQRTQLGGAPDLQRVLESGEFQYGTIGEGREVYALATYGRIVAITRQVLINDDLDAFTRLPASFGASAADLESDIVYSILMQNPAMGDGKALFHADHNNMGTASAISEAALASAYRAFGQHKGLEDRLISILPRYLLTPPGPRAVEARKQVTATTPSSTAEVNTFSGRLEVIEEPRLIPATGQDPWFLAADPSRIDTVEYAYLDGQEGVFTETRTGFEVDGLEIKARHDFAAKAIDWRGLYRNAGAAPA
ncbi:peptidase U35 [Haematobacter missouriensis]|uniref:Peptidase U35 n=1 Tax=Haematobacter missouriensis TaxID=366616 RepID=A0A212AIH5_9RHOB|nr:prohead protease/major capsid protein fusion protein [Haematobacter missouriensis]KFI32639.1 peptidase U35 [Haematobacter missouriensis]OWJ81304.1 peptidase U35 [Haematobacter missouriensis]